MKPGIELYIEELVLEGFEQVDKRRIAEAVERELTHLFTQRGVPRSLADGGEISHLDGGIFQVAPDSRPETIGIKVAHAIYGGFKK